MVNNKMVQIGTEKSLIRLLYEEARNAIKLKGSENVFDYTLGNPSVLPPTEINSTICSLVMNEDVAVHGYTSSAGLVTTRKCIVDDLNRRFDVSENENLVYLTAGAAASLTITLNALLNPLDEVIVLAPYFPEYKVFIEKAGGKCVTVATNPNTFMPRIDLIRNSINSMTKAIIINSPNNPTGVLYGEDVLKELASLLKEMEIKYSHDIYLISDEPYREILFDSLKYPFVTKYYNNSIICYSFSKSLSLPGERIGYILVSNSMNDKDTLYCALCGSGRALGFVCAPSLFQYVLKTCCTLKSDVTIYERNKNVLYQYLIHLGYQVIKPEGTFYLFVKSLEEDANNFSNVCKNFGLYLVPSDSFGVKGYVRIAYCVKMKQIENSKIAFKRVYDYYHIGGTNE